MIRSPGGLGGLSFKMRITLNITAPTHDGDLLSLEILPETTVSTLKESVQAESHIPKTSQHLYHNGQLLNDDTKTMEQLSIGDGEMLALHVRDMVGSRERVRQQPSQQQQPRQQQRGSQAQPDPETLRLQFLGQPAMRQQLETQRPELAAVLDNPEMFAQTYQRMQTEEQQAQYQRSREIADLNEDPFDIDAQTRIAEMIRQERVQENLQNAIEHNPEVFGRVHMLYIDVEVNGHKVKAFVDSGAQATIMSPSCAEKCGIMRLVDTRFAGIARGVGTAAILGRVHSAQIRIGTLFLPCSFTVMEGKDVDLLLGLDMLKRHQACIDLSKDKLVIQGVEVSFLGEADIPKNMEEERADEPKVAGPGGTTIGGRSGVVSGPSTTTQPGPQASAPPPQSQTQPAAAPGPASQPVAAAEPSFPQESIDQLVALGFSHAEAVNALSACEGNVEYAAGLLFQG
ncbi:hypothetical protein WAI453_009200 [Rhynchosporium graminicola]